jgi:hypothetical protein
VVWAKDVFFWSYDNENVYLRSYASKPPLFGAKIGISSLNVESNNFRAAQPILVISSANDAAPRKELGPKGQAAKICFLGVINKNSPKESFPAKLLHCITF